MSDREPRTVTPHRDDYIVPADRQDHLQTDQTQLNAETEHKASLISAGDNVDQPMDVEMQPGTPREVVDPHHSAESEPLFHYQHEIEQSEAVDTAPTLIGEKSAGEVREEMALGFNDTTVQPEFDPSAEQLAPEPNHVYEIPNDQEPAPWDEKEGLEYLSLENKPVPLDHKQITKQEVYASGQSVEKHFEESGNEINWGQEQHEKLPWEEYEDQAHHDNQEAPPSSVQVANILLDQQQHEPQESSVAAFEQKPAMHSALDSGVEQQAALPWETDVGAQQSASETIKEQTTATLPWEANDSGHGNLPWEPQSSTADLGAPGSITSFSQHESKAESTNTSSINVHSSVEVIDVSTQNNANLEKLFSDDDDLLLDDDPTAMSESLIQDTASSKEVAQSQEASHQQNSDAQGSADFIPKIDSNEPQDSQEDRLKALAFLEDDDILLEDELLEETVVPKPSVTSPQSEKKPTSPMKSKYAPTGTTAAKYTRSSVPTSVYTTPSALQQSSSVENEEFKRTLEQQKKKNDAYDFPTDLISTKVKPAARGHNKYDPKATSSASSVASPPPMSHNNIADARSPTSTSFGLPPANTQNSGPTPPTQQKNFFEELPIPMPNVSKPSRAGSYGSNPKSNTSPSFNSANLHPTIPTKPKPGPAPNPYANIASQQKPTTYSNHYQSHKTSPVVRQNVPLPPVQAQSPNNVRKSLATAPLVNTNLPKSGGGGPATSPYVRNAGPYAPSSHNRGHSRTNSLIGAKGKEVNPYAPAIPAVNEVNQTPIGPLPPQGQVNLPSLSAPVPIGSSAHMPLAPANQGIPLGLNGAHIVPHQTPMRTRNVSNPKTGLYGRARAQSVNKVQNPAALMKRQFPIFNWSASSQVALLIPASVTSSYHAGVGNVQVRESNKIFKDGDIITNFPGPLGKSKSKKKDVERWLESNIQRLISNGGSEDEILMNKILSVMVKHDGQIKAQPFGIDICSVLNPTLNYREPVVEPVNSIGLTPHGSKLDNAGVNHVFQLIQTGQLERAIDFAARKEDWSVALILASSLSQDKFFQVASDFSRTSFPFSKSNNKVQHLMPLIFKALSGNARGVINDLTQVPSEGEWISLHWNELVSSLLINHKPAVFDFLFELAKYFSSVSNLVASEICYMLCGLPLVLSPNPNEGFSYVGTFTGSALYSEVYEYALQLSSAAPSSPHLLLLKLKHAQILADYGAFSEAQKYCDFIDKSLKSAKNPSFTRSSFIEFQKLLVRIAETDSNESGWFGSKISKVNLEKMWGQLDKFIGGEEVKDKTDNGVFSKFSPSVSRNGSVLDFTAPNYQNSPSMRVDGNKDPLLGNYSGGIDKPYPLVRSETSTSKYFPTVGNTPAKPSFGHAHTALPGTRIQLENVEPGNIVPQVSSPASNLNPAPSRYAPFSGQVMPTASDSATIPFPPAKRNIPMASKYSPSSQKRAGYPYQNSNGAISSASIGNNGPSNLLASLHGGETRPAVSNIDGFPDRVNNRSPSIQSDVSADYPAEFRPSVHRSSDASAHEVFETVGSAGVQGAIIEESGELVSSSEQQETNSSGYVPAKAYASYNPRERHGADALSNAYSNDTPMAFQPHAVSHESATAQNPGSVIHSDYHSDADQPVTPVPSQVLAPELSAGLTQHAQTKSKVSSGSGLAELAEPVLDEAVPQVPAPPQAISEGQKSSEISLSAPPPIGPRKASKPNPYAPGASRRQTSTNRYGPSNNGKYVSKDAKPAYVANGNTGVLNLGPQNTHNTSSMKSTNLENSQMNHAVATAPEQEHEVGKGSNQPPMHALQEPPTIVKSANVDDSFEAEIYNDSKLETPEPKAHILLNSSSPKSRGHLFNPYQPGSPKDSDFGISATLGDFPIPGSPDLTTRANSVIGGAGGFFSSRLSQSQQSALYQQYEVQDDTVRDYVPIVDEEDEEDEEEEILKKEKEQKPKELEKRRNVASTQPSAAAAQRAPAKQPNDAHQSQGWLSGWLSKGNDDKPKPIRAKLGGPNKMFYSEEHKRWFTTDLSIEEQLKASAPPPPPKKKTAAAPANAAPQQSSGPSISKKGSSKLPGTPNIASTGSNTPAPGNASVGVAAEASKDGPTPPLNSASKPSLANAGLDDLLSLGGSNTSIASGRKGKRGARRYQHNMDAK